MASISAKRLREIQDMAAELEGTCSPGPDFILMTLDELIALDELVFYCSECGWWCGVDDRGGEGDVCNECLDEA